jgi:hypothetical protein
MDTEMDMITDDKLREILKDMIFQAVPEQREALERVWGEFTPQIEPEHDKQGFDIKGGLFFGCGRIVFTNRSMTSLWLLGFAAWKALYAYSAPLVLGMQVESLPDQQQFELEYSAIIQSIDELLSLENVEDFKWPDGIPIPTAKRPINEQDALVYDLICMATTYVFLHEIQHIRFSSAAERPSSHEEELGCDEYAQKLMLGNIAEYAKHSGYPLCKLKTKRGMSLALASFFLLVLTPEDLWEGSESHPSLNQRMIALADYADIPDNDSMWIYFACLIIAHLKHQQRHSGKIQFSSYKQLCSQLVGLLPA